MKRKLAVFMATVSCVSALSACDMSSSSSTASGTVYEYMVSYYFEDEDGAYALGKIDSKKIRTDEQSYAVRIPNYEGYSFNAEHEGNVTQLTLEEGKTHNYILYYSIAEYTVIAKLDDGTVWSTETLSYGGLASEPTTPKKKDHILLEWRAEQGVTFSFDSPIRKDTVIRPEWEYCEEENVVKNYVEATWFFTDEENVEHKLILSSGGNLDVMTADKSDGYGTYFYGKDGFVELDIQAGSKAGKYECEVNGLHMDFEGNDYTKNGYIITDFESESERSLVSTTIPQDPWGFVRNTATVSWVDERTANALPQMKGSAASAGAVKATLERLPYDGVNFIRGGIKVTFPEPLEKEKNGKKLHFSFGVYVVKCSGGEVICASPLDSEGYAGKAGYGKWFTLVNSLTAPCHTDWVDCHIESELVYAGDEGKVYGMSFRSFRDDDFYIDYISYYYA